MEIIKFLSKVLPDGHLSLPDDTAKDVGKMFEVILIPLDDTEIYTYAETLAKEKGFSELSEDDIEDIIHESRGIR